MKKKKLPGKYFIYNWKFIYNIYNYMIIQTKYLPNIYRIILTNRKNMFIILFVNVRHTHSLVYVRGQCVVFSCILLSSGLCGKTRALLVMPSQSALLFVRQSVFQSNLSISFFYNSFSKVKMWWEKKYHRNWDNTFQKGWTMSGNHTE